MLAPSEIVLVHALRFVDPSHGSAGARLVRPRKADLERMLVVTTAVACIVGGNVEVDLAASRLGFLPFGPQRLWVRATTTTSSWPSESLESRLCSIAQSDPGGLSLALAFRRLLGDRPKRSAVTVVEAGLQARGLDDPNALRDPKAATATQEMLAEFRESEPHRWTQLQAMADRALRPGLVLSEPVEAAPPRTPSGKRRDYLSGWKRLNPRPPSARPPKKRKLDD